MKDTRTQQERLLKVTEVSELLSVGVSTVWRKVSQGTFPKPIKISPQITRWRLSEVQKWIEDPLSYTAGGEV